MGKRSKSSFWTCYGFFGLCGDDHFFVDTVEESMAQKIRVLIKNVIERKTTTDLVEVCVRKYILRGGGEGLLDTLYSEKEELAYVERALGEAIEDEKRKESAQPRDDAVIGEAKLRVTKQAKAKEVANEVLKQKTHEIIEGILQESTPMIAAKVMGDLVLVVPSFSDDANLNSLITGQVNEEINALLSEAVANMVDGIVEAWIAGNAQDVTSVAESVSIALKPDQIKASIDRILELVSTNVPVMDPKMNEKLDELETLAYARSVSEKTKEYSGYLFGFLLIFSGLTQGFLSATQGPNNERDAAFNYSNGLLSVLAGAILAFAGSKAKKKEDQLKKGIKYGIDHGYFERRGRTDDDLQRDIESGYYAGGQKPTEPPSMASAAHR